MIIDPREYRLSYQKTLESGKSIKLDPKIMPIVAGSMLFIGVLLFVNKSRKKRRKK